jgi:hypothetical protein
VTVHIKQVCTPAGKVKFQAQVWFKGTFYAFKTFDSRPLAASYKEKSLREIVEGKLLPAAERKAQRLADLNLSRLMVDWAQDYVVAHADKHCKTRLADYLLVGTLLAVKSLEDFNGKNGARHIEQLMTEWRHSRQPRSNKPRLADAPPTKPLSDNTVRLRLTALTRLIRFAGSRLPDKAAFTTPNLDALFEFSLPPAHANPRQRVPTEHELKGGGAAKDWINLRQHPAGCAAAPRCRRVSALRRGRQSQRSVLSAFALIRQPGFAPQRQHAVVAVGAVAGCVDAVASLEGLEK